PSHGVPDASDDITGGIGWAGMTNLEKFLSEGGTLITLGGGCQLPLDGGLVGDVRRGPGGVFTPGVEVRVKFTRPDHPLAYGYTNITSVFRSNYPVYDVGVADRNLIVLQWGTKMPTEEREDKPADAAKEKEKEKDPGPMLLSGGMRGEDTLEGRPAILDLPAGPGRVLAYNFNPMHRDLNRSDYRLLWNALLNWSALLSTR
ncbi:MAG: M14 family zinc carboxypeptidase, partial [Pyrinomonadaceae bacterium]